MPSCQQTNNHSPGFEARRARPVATADLAAPTEIWRLISDAQLRRLDRGQSVARDRITPTAAHIDDMARILMQASCADTAGRHGSRRELVYDLVAAGIALLQAEEHAERRAVAASARTPAEDAAGRVA